MPDHTASTQPERLTPLTSEMFAVSDGHTLYVESVGREGGIPAVYLHGGPGSGCQPDHRKLFDANTFHAVLFDQRGAGRSVPKRSRDANTTHHLIADMEAIREKFGFARWLLVGGSWGATLALAYAQAHPTRVSGLVLRATFLGTPAELDDAFRVALPKLYPALNDDFLGLLPAAERDAPLAAYYDRILDSDPAVHGRFARAWHATERVLSEHAPKTTRLDLTALNGTQPLPSSPFMEAYYFKHGCFMQPDQLMRDAHRLENIPGIIVQGRYDLLCPPATSHALADRWSQSHIRIVENAGHSLYDSGVREAVKLGIADMAVQIAGAA